MLDAARLRVSLPAILLAVLAFVPRSSSATRPRRPETASKGSVSPDNPGEQVEPFVESRAFSFDQEANRISALEQRRVLVGEGSLEHAIVQ
jgi:hypothetical protein